ncbi:hypothetical protein PROVRUST_05449 [Providencia rustigianii DSM 4541]|uniref:Uncharacterized protein n=1 Tax=Providencia rustigianii DSM 4541 TaxID=500637 RepID=D1NZU1_9GAMM|nr:hypothetical protein PROVRUST_05449 [Providencia rustigianii DSM 4541]
MLLVFQTLLATYCCLYLVTAKFLFLFKIAVLSCTSLKPV